MPRKKVLHFDKVKAILLGVTIGLIGILVALMAFIQAKDLEGSSVTNHRVSIGAMKYDFSSGEAVKRDDETVKSLKAFLVSLTERDDELPKCNTHYSVVMASSDEKQVLLKYGCHYPSSHMFAVNENGEWRTLSPTNQFDMLGVPVCEHVNENSIEKSIAPVCVNGLNDPDAAELTYSVR